MMTLMLVLMLQDDLSETRRLMEESERLLHDLRAKTSLPVQEEIIRRLERAIEEAREAEAKAATRRSEPTPNRGERAVKPYEADRRSEPGSRFESRPGTRDWGRLGARTRESMLHASRHVDQFPAEYREMMRAYFEMLASEGK